MRRLMALVLVAVFSLGLLSGCNTVRGAGQDIQRGGEALERSAE
ncbi:entericidin A/B family lipoprotein [Halomonas salifodinae]